MNVIPDSTLLPDYQTYDGGAIPGAAGECAFTLFRREPSPIPVLLAVPHAGRSYPPSLLGQMRDAAGAGPKLEDRYVDLLAREIARATVRASFRRFFPASAATLVPERTLSAIRNVWSRYHSWGSLTSMPVSGTETVVRATQTPKDHLLCAWTAGMLEQLVILSGARTATADHESCESRGDDACLFRVSWERAATT